MYRIATPLRPELADPLEQPLRRRRARAPRSARRAARTGCRPPAPGRSRRSAAARRSGCRRRVSALMSKPHSVMTSRVCSRIRRQSTTPPRRRGLAAEEHVLGDGQARHDHGVLEHGGDPPAPRGDVAQRGAGRPSKRTSPASGATRPDRIETRVDLPGAVAADQAQAAARLQAQVDAAQRAGAAEPLVDPRRLDRRRGLRVGGGDNRFCASGTQDAEELQTPPWALPYTLPHRAGR